MMRQQVLTAGHGKHRRVIGVELDFSRPLATARAQDRASYAVVQTMPQGRKVRTRPVGFKAIYDASSDSVRLLLDGRPRLVPASRVVVTVGYPIGTVGVAHASAARARETAASAALTFFVLPGANGVLG
jgi:hypothetical protein